MIELIGSPDRPEGDRGGRVGRRDWLLLVAIVVVLLAAFGRSVDRFSRSAPEARGPDQEHDQRADDVVGAMEGVGSSPTAAESPTEVQPTTDPTASVRGGAEG
ncbi:MAG: hypothetical protein ACE5GB_13900, partial [Acidimicrobiales bacterium]